MHVCGATLARSWTHMGRTSSSILLKEDSVGKVAAPRSSCSPRRDTSDTLSAPPPNTPSCLPTRHPLTPPPHPPIPINSAFSTFKPQFPFTHTHPRPTDMHTPPQNPGPHSHSLTHRCHTSLQIKFTLGPPLSKKPKERQRGNEIEGLTSLPGSRAHDRHLLNPFIHMSQDFTKVHAYLSASLC